MALREEIEKLIDHERKKLERGTREQARFFERKQERFAPLRPALEEFSSIEPDYLRVRVNGADASLEFARRSDLRDLKVSVEPDFEVSFHGSGDFSFEEKRGFRITQTSYSHYPEFHERQSTQVIEAASEVVEFLARLVAKKLAHRRHLDSRLRRAAKVDEAEPGSVESDPDGTN